MNRHEAIEQAANEIAMALTRKGYVNIKNGKDEPLIDALYKALALPNDAAEPVAWLHQVIADEYHRAEDGETDQALSFTKESFPLEGALGYRKVSCQPLYTHPPKTAEREALCERIDDSFDGQAYRLSEKTITDIRVFLRGE